MSPGNNKTKVYEKLKIIKRKLLMWVNIIGENFKDLLRILDKRPFVIIVIGLMFTSGLFINNWILAKNDCAAEISALTDSLNNAQQEIYKHKYESLYYQRIIKMANSELDSTIREKIIKPLKEKK